MDTSLLLALLTNEAKTRRVQAWPGEQDPDELVISDWVATGLSAGLSIKLRTEGIEADHRAEALAIFTRMCSDNLTVLPMSRLGFHLAARFADQYALGLCAGDALHPAVCPEHGATICTLDRCLGDAAQALGVKTAQLLTRSLPEKGGDSRRCSKPPSRNAPPH